MNDNRAGSMTGQSIKKHRRVHYAVLVAGLLSFLWYFIRVLPKPSRAAYPCQRAAYPLRLGFLGYLAALAASTISFRKAKLLMRNREFLRAALLLPIICLPLIIVFDNNAMASASAANAPAGVAKGIFPGRVAWVYAPAAAQWTGKGNYWADSVNPQAEYNKAFTAGVISLSGGTSEADAWNRIFLWFNGSHGRSGTGYRAGDKIAIKINQNNAPTSAPDDGDTINANPHSAVACVASLVNAGVPQADIVIGDPSRAVTDNVFNAVHNAYPNVQVVDYYGNGGRVTSGVTSGAFPFGATDGIPDSESTCFYNARYLINLPLMKGHTGQVITFAAKNFYGITGINSDWTKNGGHHPGTVSLTGFMTSPNFGRKVVLWCMDAMYPDSNLDGTPSLGWAEAPFYGKPMASFIMSLDGVAEESVSADFFGNHYGTGTDGQDYIVDAADSGAGVEEHWNNPIAKQYSRNIDSVNGKGIQLVCLRTSPAAVRPRSADEAKMFKIDGLSNNTVRFTLPQAAAFRLLVVDMRGAAVRMIARSRGAKGGNVVSFALNNLPRAAYALRLESMGMQVDKVLVPGK